MTYVCKSPNCVRAVTNRVRLRDKDGMLAIIDLCDAHAEELQTAVVEIVPGTVITHVGRIKVDDDGEEINQGSVH